KCGAAGSWRPGRPERGRRGDTMPCRHLYDAHEGHGGDDTDAASRMTPFTYREVTLHERLRESARDVGTKAAVIHGERTTTFADLDAASERLAGALARRGVGHGDRVTLFMPNSVEFVIAFYATLKAGGVVNPINAQSKEREVRFQIEDSGAKAVLVHEALWPVIQPIAHELASARLMASTGADATGPTRFDDLVAEGRSAPGG